MVWRLPNSKDSLEVPESNFTPEIVKIAVNIVCLTKKTEEKSDHRERSYDFMNAGIRKRKIRPFRDASALMGASNKVYRQKKGQSWKFLNLFFKSGRDAWWWVGLGRSKLGLVSSIHVVL